MKVRSRHSDKKKDESFINWFYRTSNKDDFVIVDWGDLVYWQLIDKDGNKNDHRITARDHAIRIIDLDSRNNTLRELSEYRTKN